MSDHGLNGVQRLLVASRLNDATGVWFAQLERGVYSAQRAAVVLGVMRALSVADRLKVKAVGEHLTAAIEILEGCTRGIDLPAGYDDNGRRKDQYLEALNEIKLK